MSAEYMFMNFRNWYMLDTNFIHWVSNSNILQLKRRKSRHSVSQSDSRNTKSWSSTTEETMNRETCLFINLVKKVN